MDAEPIDIDAIADYVSGAHNGLDDADLRAVAGKWRRSVHLAIMRQPYLDYVIDGTKTVESRLTKNRIPPFQTARAGDVILFKESGGPIRAVSTVARCEYFLASGADHITQLTAERASSLAYDPGYVDSKVDSKYVSFLHLAGVRPTSATPFEKRSRQSWVTIHPPVPSLISAADVSTRSVAVLFSGDLAGGKSSVGERLSALLRVPRLSFGSLVRTEASLHGLDTDDRRVLQQVGEGLIESLGADGLVAKLLAMGPTSAVIEGVRHVDVLDCLLAQYRSAVHVHLTATAEELARRWRYRSETVDLSDASVHSTETEVPLLRSRAHLVIDTTERSPELVVATIAAYLGMSPPTT